MVALKPAAAVVAPEKAKAVASCHLKTHTASEMSDADIKGCTARPRVDFTSILNTVRASESQTRSRLDCPKRRMTVQLHLDVEPWRLINQEWPLQRRKECAAVSTLAAE